jgi:hypothetical protein
MSRHETGRSPDQRCCADFFRSIRGIRYTRPSQSIGAGVELEPNDAAPPLTAAAHLKATLRPEPPDGRPALCLSARYGCGTVFCCSSIRGGTRLGRPYPRPAIRAAIVFEGRRERSTRGCTVLLGPMPLELEREERSKARRQSGRKSEPTILPWRVLAMAGGPMPTSRSGGRGRGLRTAGFGRQGGGVRRSGLGVFMIKTS